MDAFDESDPMQELVKLAAQEPALDLSQYGEEYLKTILTYLSPPEVHACLQDSQASFEDLRALEKDMCQRHFLQLLDEDHFFSGGKDVSGRSVLFMRPPDNLFEYHMGTPRTAALIRYVIWGVQIFWRKRIRSKNNLFTVIVYDYDRGPLDFNLSLMRSCLKLAVRLFPGPLYRVWYFANKSTKRVWWAIRSVLRGHFDPGEVRLVTDKDRIHSILHASTEYGALPRWFKEDGKRTYHGTKPDESGEDVLDKQSLLESPYERCLGRGRTTITMADMFHISDENWEGHKPTMSSNIPVSRRALGTIASRPRSASPRPKFKQRSTKPAVDIVVSNSLPTLEAPQLVTALSAIEEDCEPASDCTFLQRAPHHNRIRQRNTS